MAVSKNLLIINWAFSLIGWLVGFIGLCTSGKLTSNQSWWITVYNAGLIVFLFCVVWMSKQKSFAPLLLSLLSIGILYNTQEVTAYIENEDRRSTFYATAAGYILLIVTQFIWLTAFGIRDISHGEQISGRSGTEEQLIASASTSTPNVLANNGNNNNGGSNNNEMTMAQHQNMLVNDAMNTVYVSPHAEFKIPVVALHAYGANPDDPNELSFEKGEILYVHDKKGSWWQAKKSDCTVGMIPSNYVSCTTSSGY
ncbi:hypothetical protein BCR42DRAFT_490019 [Absidia repens]|uniref:SH3 domain-containing protein n=1 Tax=Absidia repens TaxID=90262 RepID=A0A1X2ILN5_9FUNG|nr:hypothetical protein BCR42DRAFT_490019 [Absidia repens]